MTLGFDTGPPADALSQAAEPSPSAPLVEVAVDAAGAGGARPYTYQVPERLAGLEPGEAVLVGFGRRQALGIVLGPAATGSADARGGGHEIRPVIDRVRADGPLLPRLPLALAR